MTSSPAARLLLSPPVIQGAQGPGEGADRREVGEAQEPVRVGQGLVEGRMLLVLYSKTTPFFMRGLLRPASFENMGQESLYTEHGTKPRGLFCVL